MEATAVFPRARRRAGMYESFYLRAFSPEEPIGIWIRHTIHKAPDAAARGSVWCTVFDAGRGRPFMHKATVDDPGVPAGGWIAIGAAASMGSTGAKGRCGEAQWSLRYSSAETELRHLSPGWLYAAPLPRTKLTSPAPSASFDGTLELPGRARIELRGWPGMVGHNWGSEHAERWIWLHACGFAEDPGAWIDVALGRLRLAGRMTPWVANGAFAHRGERHAVGGLGARGLAVGEHVDGCELQLPLKDGRMLLARVRSPEGTQAGWRYSDPDGPEHDVVNCSIASLELSLGARGNASETILRSAHGCAYELGMRERDHGVPLAAFADG